MYTNEIEVTQIIEVKLKILSTNKNNWIQWIKSVDDYKTVDFPF